MYLYNIFFECRSCDDQNALFLILDQTRRSSGSIIPVVYFLIKISRQPLNLREKMGHVISDILKLDSRFVSLVRWLGENHIHVRLIWRKYSQKVIVVYKIREIASWRWHQIICRRWFPSVYDRTSIRKVMHQMNGSLMKILMRCGDDMKLTSIQSITDFMTCAGSTLPDNIRLWARRNLAVAKSHEVSQEERRHAQTCTYPS